MKAIELETSLSVDWKLYELSRIEKGVEGEKSV